MQKRVKSFGLFLFALCLLMFVPLMRATIFGSIRGVVHDPQHRPIAGVEVTLKSSTSAWSQTVQTDQSGQFQFDAVAVGEYTINITHSGFRDVSERVVVTSSSSPVLHFELKIAGTTQSVQVSAEEQSQEIDTASSTTQTLVTHSDIAASPGATRTSGRDHRYSHSIRNRASQSAVESQARAWSPRRPPGQTSRSMVTGGGPPAPR